MAESSRSPRRPGRGGRVLALAAALWLAAGLAASGPRPARADVPAAGAADGPGDASTEGGPGPLALNRAPSSFVDERIGEVRWEYPPAAAEEVAPLQARVPETWARIEGELGGDVPDALRIRVGLDPKQMGALAPVGAPPPPYAVGVAYPSIGLVLLTLTAPNTWQAPDLPRVLDHELSHVALLRRVGGAALPRWLVEGVAIHQAREQNMARVRALGDAVYGKGPIPLDELSDRFPMRHHEVNLAYAQSADFVAFLLRGEDGERRFGKMLERVRGGEPFEAAVVDTHRGASIRTLEREWRADLQERFAYWPLGLTTGLLGALGLALVLWGRWRRREKETPVLERWAEEEALLDQLQATQAEAEARDTGPGPAGGSDDAGDDPAASRARDDAEATAALVRGGPKRSRVDPDGVPRVRVDGQTHTLH